MMIYLSAVIVPETEVTAQILPLTSFMLLMFTM